MELDPDDPRPPYQQVAGVLRGAILERTFQPGDKMPSGTELAERFGVARMTVQQAIRLLRDEGLIVSRQGSGVFVRERTARPVGLRPHIEQAFEEPDVTFDFAGFSGETLHGALIEPLDKVRHGRYQPDSIRVRLLVPDTTKPWSLPARVDDGSDSPAFRERAGGILRRHVAGIVDAVEELGSLGFVKETKAEVRALPVVPLFKLYVLNGTETFSGYYPVREHSLQLDDEQVAIWDLMGKDATLFHHVADGDPDSTATQFVEQSTMWFESIWHSVAGDLEL